MSDAAEADARSLDDYTADELEDLVRDLADEVTDLKAELAEQRSEVETISGVVGAHGRQLARIRAVIAGDDDAFWDLDPDEPLGNLVDRLAIAEAKMDGFAQGLRKVKGGGDGE